MPHGPVRPMHDNQRVTEISPATDAQPASWVLRAEVDWWELVRYGPPGFAAYARIAFSQEPEPEVDAVRVALASLAAYTTTPASGYAAVWEGWGGPEPGPVAPRLEIPHRTMLLFRGDVRALRDAPALAWYGAVEGVRQEPHLVWPEDRAWCLACEVDEEIEFSVGCSVEAFEALAAALPGSVRRAAYGEPAPMYRDRG